MAAGKRLPNKCGNFLLSMKNQFTWACISRDLYQVSQRDVPGIDAAYLAVDIEEGTEVVWNEVSFSKSKAKRDKVDC